MKKKGYIILLIISIVMAILILEERIAIPCIFNKITGLYCPGCGITRAIRAIIKGDFSLSFRQNALLYTVIPIYILAETIKRIVGKKFNKAYNVIVIILVIIALIYGVLRNIPQFSYLAPIIV